MGVSLLVLDWARRHVVAHDRVERSLADAAYGAFVAAVLVHALRRTRRPGGAGVSSTR